MRQVFPTQTNSPTYPQNTLVWCKNRGHIFCKRRVIANLLLKFSNFRYHGNRGWFETNFAYTDKPPVWCKNREPISCKRRVIASFLLVSNFSLRGLTILARPSCFQCIRVTKIIYMTLLCPHVYIWIFTY